MASAVSSMECDHYFSSVYLLPVESFSKLTEVAHLLRISYPSPVWVRRVSPPFPTRAAIRPSFECRITWQKESLHEFCKRCVLITYLPIMSSPHSLTFRLVHLLRRPPSSKILLIIFVTEFLFIKKEDLYFTLMFSIGV